MSDNKPNTPEETPYEYSRCSYYHSSTTTDKDGRKITSSWRGGYGHENKDGRTRYFVLPSESDGRQFIEANHEDFKRTQEHVQEYLNRPVPENPKSEPHDSQHISQHDSQHDSPPCLSRRMTPFTFPAFDALRNSFMDDMMWSINPFEMDELTRLRRENARLKQLYSQARNSQRNLN